jgi:hypothetical protein
MQWLLNGLLRLYRRYLESQIDFNSYNPELSRKLDSTISLLEADEHGH